ncbi:MAG TPA: beta-N-acetylhexosaminidase [Puia sp.]|nr:beta-N-acetylhexosaminidase [Puia sp.]
MKTYLHTLLLFFITLSANAQSPTQKDFPIKGFHLDLRIQIMKMPALKALARDLHQQGINTLLMEWEASYPFQEEPQIANRYTYSRAEINDFIRCCHKLNIDVIPLQQSFGHVEYILRNYKFAGLREDEHDLSQLCPAQKELNKQLFTRLYQDLAATHSSPYIHIGCDETHLLGHCPRCQKLAAEEGLSKLYFDHVKMLCDIVISLGKRPVLWADIALKHLEYLQLLPKQTILIDWNYGWDLDRFGDHSKLAGSGYEIWGSPALRSEPDNYYLTRWQHHLGNISQFIPQCRQLGYKGVIMTSWSTSGVYNPLFNADDELAELYPVRHVYPLAGFNLLISAYTRALHNEEKFEPEHFITTWCQNRYGLNEAAARRFQKALFNAPYKVINGKVISPSGINLAALLDSAREAAQTMHTLNPGKNQMEFGHYRLMADIRVYYLTYINIEAAANAANSIREYQNYAGRLRALMATEPLLDQTFRRLNGGTLYPAAIQEENAIRIYRTHQLYQRLTGLKIGTIQTSKITSYEQHQKDPATRTT